MSGLGKLKKELRKHADPQKAKFSSRFFKMGPGEYAEGDQSLGGINVPTMRKIARQYNTLSRKDTQSLLYSPFHEERLVALLILVSQFMKADEMEKEEIYIFYLKHRLRVNNWDLVDSSAYHIVGGYLLNKKDRSILIKLARSVNLWEKRIAMIATYQFIKHQEYQDTFKIAEILLHDKHDLIHKAVGWMLREVGKRVSREKEEEFLKKYYKTMPRTMLRYAIEHFPEEKRKAYLVGSI